MNTALFAYRNVIFSKKNKTISLIDIYNPENRGESLEPWLGIVFELADGQHTIKEIVDYLSRSYKGAPPANLEDTVISVTERLVEMKFLVLTEKATELPYYLSLPYEHLDVKKAKEMIREDKAKNN